MPQIETEGKYNVRIVSASIRPMNKADDLGAFALVLKGETEDGYHAWGDILFTNGEFASGHNAGKLVKVKAEETLESLGVERGYIGNIADAINSENGLFAQFVMKWDEYKGVRKLKCAYVNPLPTLIPIEDVDIEALMARLNGTAPAGQPLAGERVVAPAPDKDGPEDQIPF